MLDDLNPYYLYNLEHNLNLIVAEAFYILRELPSMRRNSRTRGQCGANWTGPAPLHPQAAISFSSQTSFLFTKETVRSQSLNNPFPVLQLRSSHHPLFSPLLLSLLPSLTHFLLLFFDVTDYTHRVVQGIKITCYKTC